MAQEKSQSAILGNMQRFLAAITANAADLQHLEGSRSSFETLLREAGSLAQEQMSLTASKQEMTQQLTSTLTEMQRLATVLRLAVKQHYGISSEKLAEFGLQPFRGRRRKLPLPPPPPPVESNPPETVSSQSGL